MRRIVDDDEALIGHLELLPRSANLDEARKPAGQLDKPRIVAKKPSLVADQ